MHEIRAIDICWEVSTSIWSYSPIGLLGMTTLLAHSTTSFIEPTSETTQKGTILHQPAASLTPT